ncbi:hypothetical protein CDL15_Pgr027373 [Punica granatum]|uniref:Uncharacterized protein n=1 Tax=Punica granatum TaxID=22663 RepID=A0A218Y1X7_PUNGR|nr:hypothetical protein CDL15_Pgr027373 [Punica granatum]
MPQLCDEGFCFAGCCAMRDSSSRVERLRIPSGRESEYAVVLVVFVHISSLGSPKRPVKNFALTVQMDAALGGLDARPLGAPVSYVWAYRDVPDDALAALSVVLHAYRL